MNTRTYLRLSLLTPYLLWLTLAGILFLINRSSSPMESGTVSDVILGAAYIYTIGIGIWILPYTLLAVGLWIWSKGKPADKTARLFAFSPLIMAILVAVEMGILSILWGGGGASSDFGASMLAIGGLAILFGYLIIGMVAGMYKLFSRIHIIR
jgi:hypothetical protein